MWGDQARIDNPSSLEAPPARTMLHDHHLYQLIHVAQEGHGQLDPYHLAYHLDGQNSPQELGDIWPKHRL